jgi:UrcA family protein
MSTFKPSRSGVALLLLGCLAGVMAAGVAGAATSALDPPSIVIKYSDLTLATDSGVHHLYGRILTAAKQVCPDARFLDFHSVHLVDACRNQAVARAIRQIDNTRLTSLYATHTKNG